MNLRVRCSTSFDIAATGVKNRFYKSRIPFVDDTGLHVIDDATWTRSRNRQSNWETVNQIISLRTLPENITTPVYNENAQRWEFEFEVVDANNISVGSDELGLLIKDCNNVPMILGLNEPAEQASVLITDGPDTNIWFEVINK